MAVVQKFPFHYLFIPAQISRCPFRVQCNQAMHQTNSRHYVLFFLLFLFAAAASHAQQPGNITLSGKVFDGITHQPLTGAPPPHRRAAACMACAVIMRPGGH
jgi:hypothetical protein